MKLLFVVTEDWYFYSHRLALAQAALAAGYEVHVATRVHQHGDLLRSSGISVIPFEMSRGRGRGLAEILTVIRLIRLYRKLRPDIVHHVAIKPVLYGSLASKFVRIPVVVNAIAGLGWVFSSTTWRARALAIVMRLAFRFLLRSGTTIVQNPDDARWLANLGIDRSHIQLIRGAGVDTRQFQPATAEPPGEPLIILPARMLASKGVVEFVEAARLARQAGIRARFALVGREDAGNPSAISAERLQHWQAQGLVEWWGNRDDMVAVLHQCHIVCLPSYSEGLPKALIEAAACGLPIVTCDVPGCREVVIDDHNGLLVKARAAQPLADALARLIADAELRKRMGANGRAMAVREFAIERVVEATMAIYQTGHATIR